MLLIIIPRVEPVQSHIERYPFNIVKLPTSCFPHKDKINEGEGYSTTNRWESENNWGCHRVWAYVADVGEGTNMCDMCNFKHQPTAAYLKSLEQVN